jgi:hypothetical protein
LHSNLFFPEIFAEEEMESGTSDAKANLSSHPETEELDGSASEADSDHENTATEESTTEKKHSKFGIIPENFFPFRLYTFFS